jgi:hypothetical protein
LVLPADPLPEIEWLYRSRLVQFVRVARAIVGDEQLALEAVQEAFTRAVEKRRAFRRSRSIDAWEWRIGVERGTVSATLSSAHRNLAKRLQEAIL